MYPFAIHQDRSEGFGFYVAFCTFVGLNRYMFAYRVIVKSGV